MLKKILIIPYFGEFNNYFSLWLHSCGMNPGIDFLVVTDNVSPEQLPSNVYWVQESFVTLQQLFQQKMDCKLWLKKPYKLCDYKGFYGYLFSEYLQGYDFWGYCDCDVIFGDLEHFLPEQLFYDYDKIMLKGHLSFVRNTTEVNENFRKYTNYRVALSTSIMYGYDEAVYGYHNGLAGELMEQGFRFCAEPTQPADIDYRFFPFYIVGRTQEPCVFTYEKGKLYRVTQNGEKEEMIYLHLQKRAMQVRANDPEYLLIYPNTIADLNEDLLKEDSFWEATSQNQKDYFDFAAEIRRERLRDIRRFLHEPRKIECLRYRMSNR